MTTAPLDRTEPPDRTGSSAHPSAASPGVLPDHGTYATADPALLDIGPNVRTDAALDPHFCADVREHGVEVAVDVRRRSDGVLVVRDGERRVLAARRAQLPAVPIRIRPDAAEEPDTDPDARGERIVGQLRANRHRLATPPADEAAATQQLLELGWSPARIARATRMPARIVRAATAAGGSKFAVAAMRRHSDQLTLDHAAVLAEFDDDPEALKAITLTALQQPAALEHHAQRLRDRRDIEALRAHTEQSLRGQGHVIVARDHDTWQALARLRWNADVRPGHPITEDQHRGCPGHAAVVDATRSWTDDNTLFAEPRWGCTEPAAHGHAPLHPDTGTGGSRGGPMTEQEKADRRRVIANNKAWDSAQTVRRRWLRDLLCGTKPPADAAVFIAVSLGQAHYALARALGDRNTLACQLLRLDTPPPVLRNSAHPLAAAAEQASAPRATVIVLAVVLAGFEADTGRHTWRHPETATQQYLRQLQAWGYRLSEVEQLVLGPPDTEPVLDPPDTEQHGDAAVASPGTLPAPAPDPDSA